MLKNLQESDSHRVNFTSLWDDLIGYVFVKSFDDGGGLVLKRETAEESHVCLTVHQLTISTKRT